MDGRKALPAKRPMRPARGSRSWPTPVGFGRAPPRDARTPQAANIGRIRIQRCDQRVEDAQRPGDAQHALQAGAARSPGDLACTRLHVELRWDDSKARCLYPGVQAAVPDSDY
jgi:hypothetical protein